VALAGSLDQLAARLRLCAQGSESAHAGIRGGALTGQRRNKSILRERLARVKGNSGKGQRHKQVADHHGFSPAKPKRVGGLPIQARFPDNGVLRLKGGMDWIPHA
jgi:hypothetical protein